MAKGNSGRIVVEIDPELKQELYEALGEQGLNLKQWFLENVDELLSERIQPSLPLFSSSELSKEA
jgi:hypothetical protein